MKITKETTLHEYVRGLVGSTQHELLAEVVKRLKAGATVHLDGINYNYPASEVVQGIVNTIGSDYKSVSEEFCPSWLQRVEDLLKEISNAEGYGSTNRD